MILILISKKKAKKFQKIYKKAHFSLWYNLPRGVAKNATRCGKSCHHIYKVNKDIKEKEIYKEKEMAACAATLYNWEAFKRPLFFYSHSWAFTRACGSYHFGNFSSLPPYEPHVSSISGTTYSSLNGNIATPSTSHSISTSPSKSSTLLFISQTTGAGLP